MPSTTECSILFQLHVTVLHYYMYWIPVLAKHFCIYIHVATLAQDFALQTVVSWLYRNKNEFLAGVAVSLTMVPTSVAFAFLAELSPQVSCMCMHQQHI
jgi:hypothetical protein